MWNLNGGVDFRYRGDWVSGSYTDGDIVVYQGITYLCVKPTSAVPVVWASPVASNSPSVRVYRSTVQSIPSGGWTKVTFDSVRHDNGGPHWLASAPTRLTCKVAGTYQVSSQATFVTTAGGYHRIAQILLNNATTIGTAGMAGATIAAGPYPYAPPVSLVRLSVGDYVELSVYQDSGSAVNLQNSDVGTSWTGADLAMALVGGPQGPPGVAAGYGTTLPGSPYDGQEHILVDSTTVPTYQWRLRYNANSTSAYKWEYVGGTPWFATAYSGTWQQFSGSSNWVAANPGLNAPRAGDYWISWSAQFQALPGGATLVQIGGGVPGNFGMSQALTPTQSGSGMMTAVFDQKINGIASGATMQPYVWANANTATLANLACRINPARIS